jgi:hypothetical protein
MSHKTFMFAVVFVVMFVTTGRAQNPPALNSLSWLSGCWEGRQGEALIEEHWSKPEGQSMLGFSRTLKDVKTVRYAFLQMRQMPTGLEYMLAAGELQRVSFKLAKADNGRYVFESAAHDFPQRIIYERQGAMMMTSVEGLLKGKPEKLEFIMRRVRCNEPTN